MARTVQNYSFDRSKVGQGIVHIGVGNFHRAHQEFYTNMLLEKPGHEQWGFCGVMLLPSDERLYQALKASKGEYTLTVCGRTGKDEVYRIGALQDVIWGVREPGRVIDKIADASTRIITLTITEGGYNIDKATGEFLTDTPAVAHDIANPADPTTVFGFVAEGLRRRRAAGGEPVTILSCDNLQHNGNTARKAFTSFFRAQDAELADWVEQNVTFPNSMVDRITPATRPADIERLNAENGTDDQAPVYCEDFLQWVIEDKFAAGRPEWEAVGAEFTDDVTAYENMKLSLLNASHTLLSYPSFLAGYRKVDDAMHDPRIERFVRQFMDIDITPYVPAPGNTDLELYKQTLIERFGNRSVSDQIARLCFDGVSKFPVYVVPNMKKMIADEADMTRVAFLIAAYRHYLKYHTDANGDSFEIAEPWLTEEDNSLISSDDPMDFLDMSAFAGAGLRQAPGFFMPYLAMVEAIADDGVMPTLETVIG